VVVGALAASPVALAGDARLDVRRDADDRESAVLVFSAHADETNNAQVELIDAPRALLVRDVVAIGAGAGCSSGADPNNPNVELATCALPPQASVGGVRLHLGDGNDRGSGGGLRDAHLFGGPGADDLGGGVRLYGGTGDDFLEGSDRRGLLVGGAGRDTLNGGQGPERIVPGPGRDIMFTVGDELARARDVVESRDGTTDEIYCMRRDRHDRLVADALDFVDGCARPLRSSPSFGVPIDIRPDVDGRGAIVTVGCSNDGPRVCRGSYTIIAGRRALDRTRFRLSRADGSIGFETESQLVRRAWLRLRRVRVALRSFDSRGRLRARTLVLPITGA
jgi:hypothetical protein